MLIAWRWNVRTVSEDRLPADSWDIAVTHTYRPGGDLDTYGGQEGHTLLMQWRNTSYPYDPARRGANEYFVTEEARRGIAPLDTPVPFWTEGITPDLKVLVAFATPDERYGDNEQEHGSAFRVGYRYRDQISWLKRLDPLLNEKHSAVVQPGPRPEPRPQSTREGTEDVPRTVAGMEQRITELLRTPRADTGPGDGQ